MKSPSLQQFFHFCTILSFIPFLQLSAQVQNYPYEQDFEGTFSAGQQLEFLPHWWANEVSNGTSRIYQAGAADAFSGQAALGVAPTGKFSGDIRLHFDASSLETAELSFWARSGQSGSGSRPAELNISFSANGGETFTEAEKVGGENAFPNENTEYNLYQLNIPEEILGSSEAVLRLQVSRGTGGEGTAARIFIDDLTINQDPASFRLLSAKALDQNTVELLFNRKIDASTAENTASYQLNEGMSVVEARLDEENRRRVILETSPLQAETLYTIRMGNVLDEEGNSAEGQEITFRWEDSYQIQVFNLLISEIHAAPNESTLLPNVEWVEIYNASGRTLQLEGVQFADESRNAMLPAYAMRAGEYLVLAPAAEAAQLEEYGEVLGLTAWPSLNNNEDVLSLYSPESRLIDRVAYRQSWYGSGEKSQGGWSLERIDLNNPCIGGANWTASRAVPGGTPAQPNSVASDKPDTRGPELELAFVADFLTIELVFNEAIDTTQLAASQIELLPGIPFEGIAPMRDQPERLRILLGEALMEDVKYQVLVSGLQDCSGNQLESSSIELAYPVGAGKGEVVINEVMFDPPPNSEEWVEIANTTESYLDLQNWQLASWNNGIKATAVLSREHLILPPGGVLAFSRDKESVKTAFPSAPDNKLLQLAALPVLVNSGDTLVLLDSDGHIVDKFRYYPDLHSPFLRETKGISLERISLQGPTNTPDNWTSAAATVNYGTPGEPNSQLFSGKEAPEDQLLIEPEVIRPGSPAPTGFASIRFRSQRAGLQLTIKIFDGWGRLVRTLVQNELAGPESFFTWDGTAEDNSKVRTGYYIVFLRVWNAEGYKNEFKKVLVVGN